MPNHRHKVDSTSASIANHTHNLTLNGYAGSSYNGTTTGWGNDDISRGPFTATTSSAGGGATGSFAPYTDYQGSGQSFSIMPPYIAINIWKRLS